MEGAYSLPLGSARLERPSSVFRYTFEHFVYSKRGETSGPPVPAPLTVVPIEAVAAGDVQVSAACEQGKQSTPVIDLDVLADFPTVESVVASTRLRTSRQLPEIRELLLYPTATIPEASTPRHLTDLELLYALPPPCGDLRLDLDVLPAAQMRKLALNRWLTVSVAPPSKK